ncbi:Na+/H+ antiporter subunit E [Marinobacter halophilus]|uniref:Na+/H+ antiporter subunit E n=1 Tax=Marinobacter halophilus TaxID=1323740 RepID=A0A2T1KHU2_9GAMM|nr:Na+/H+ antiporter subunit E [Marinobacter halophilus]PSF09580.1 Na+/H+ antiporter subunit E [Marinobacter halophilus]GGC65853.1 Na+/H+ antiporter subunit E [Marinobacter halophilus]
MTWLQRWLPHPLFTGFLVLLWLLMNQFSFAHLLLGSVLAVVISLVTQPFWPERSRVKYPGKLLVYLGRLLLDILKSNLVVARRILFQSDDLKPGFFTYPLSLTDDFAVTMLASTISLTPGTVSAHYDREGRTLLIHCLHLDDEEALIQDIHRRYELPLQEIFDD